MNLLNLKIAASLISLFGLGAGSGYVIGHRTQPLAVPPAVPAEAPPSMTRTNTPDRFFSRWSEARVVEYRELLKLTPEQETALKSHLALLATDYGAMRAEVRRKMVESITRANTAIARDLTPDQRRLFWHHVREKTKRAD
jgi:hypothetical protein